MAWLDDRVWCHPKFNLLSDKAWRVGVGAIAYSSGFGTHGVLSTGDQKQLGSTVAVKKELITAGLWDDGEKGEVSIHDWRDYNKRRDERNAAATKRKRERRTLSELQVEVMHYLEQHPEALATDVADNVFGRRASILTIVKELRGDT